MVLVECESQGEAENILKNGHKLRGSQVFLDKDLTLEKQANKMALLELKKFLLAIRRETKVKVQNDSINKDGNCILVRHSCNRGMYLIRWKGNVGQLSTATSTLKYRNNILTDT